MATGGRTGAGGTATGGRSGAGGTATGGMTGAGGIATGGRTGAGGTTAAGGMNGTGGTTLTNPDPCPAKTNPVARHGKLRVMGNRIVNQCGRPVQLVGISLDDWTPEGRQFYNANAVKNLAGTGEGQKRSTVLRVPLLPENWPGEYPRVKTVMDACIANGIYCIADWLVYGASDVTNAKAYYVQLAKDYGNTPNLIYEPWDEATTSTWAQIKAYHEEVIAAVRPIDPDNLFLLGNRQWDQRPDEACASPVSDPQSIYVFHFNAAGPLSGLQGRIDSCLTSNVAVFSTLYGITISSSSNSLSAWQDYMDQNLIGSTYWAVSNKSGQMSSVFVSGASVDGPWPDSQITDAGRTGFAYIAKRYDVTMSQ